MSQDFPAGTPKILLAVASAFPRDRQDRVDGDLPWDFANLLFGRAGPARGADVDRQLLLLVEHGHGDNA